MFEDSQFDDATIEPKCAAEHNDMPNQDSCDPPEEEDSSDEDKNLLLDESKSGAERDSMVLMGEMKQIKQHKRETKGSGAIHIEEQELYEDV